jgi:hypothetical protein
MEQQEQVTWTLKDESDNNASKLSISVATRFQFCLASRAAYAAQRVANLG